ncbi:amidase [Rhodobacterales bacterium HKCCE3408]|nr:amidase [Rhodobacterales bacterium HKCCE3408]
MDVRQMGVAELGRGIGAGRFDPVDLAETFLAAAADRTDVYARLTPDRARAEAAAARARAKAGIRRGLLDGVPISWKDLFDTAGVVTEAGSALLKGRVPETDAEVLRQATLAGLVCIGKTNLSELAFSGLGLNPVTGTPPNRHNPDLVPGGSSSGAAVSVALGLAPAGIGSDTGGSVRVPAAWNDLVGLKTTWGRLSNAGVVPLVERLDTVGPLTRNVEDAALLLAVMEGGPAADLSGATLEGAHFLVLDPFASDVREEPGAAFEDACAKLSAAGATIERGRVAAAEEAMDLSIILYAGEAYGIWRDVIEAAPEKMFRPILERFRGGREFSAPDFVDALRRRDAYRTAYYADTAGYDAVILPTAANLPPERERLLSDDAYYATENLLTLRNARVGNLMGVSALTLPTGVPSCGLMMFTPPMAEGRLLRLGAAAEAALA